MLDMGFIHDIRRILALLPASAPERCSSRRPCPTRSASSGLFHEEPGDASKSRGASPRREARHAVQHPVDRAPQERCSRTCVKHPTGARSWSSRAPSTAPTASRSLARDGIERSRSTATRPRTTAPGTGALQGQRAARPGRHRHRRARPRHRAPSPRRQLRPASRRRGLRPPHRPHRPRRRRGRSRIAREPRRPSLHGRHRAPAWTARWKNE